MSLNMLIETREGFDFTGTDCMSWFRDAGFVETRVERWSVQIRWSSASSTPKFEVDVFR
jgi:hypothetical protein